jgi:hypothetical protein
MSSVVFAVDNRYLDLKGTALELVNVTIARNLGFSLFVVSNIVPKLELILRDCKFINNVVVMSVFYAANTPENAKDSAISFYNTDLGNNLIVGPGSLILFSGRAVLLFSNVSFNSIKTNNNGGIVVAQSTKSSLTFDGCKFANINIGKFGGVIFFTQGGTIVFRNSSFENISATEGGIAFMNSPYVWRQEDASISFVRCRFKGISVLRSGGILKSLDKLSVTIEDSQIEVRIF